jgi:methylphosphotriester-DNA--protein-cysteine methyltransferase
MKIEAAAPAVGYKSKKDFYRAVRLHTGLTPGQLRRQRMSTAASMSSGSSSGQPAPDR